MRALEVPVAAPEVPVAAPEVPVAAPEVPVAAPEVPAPLDRSSERYKPREVRKLWMTGAGAEG